MDIIVTKAQTMKATSMHLCLSPYVGVSACQYMSACPYVNLSTVHKHSDILSIIAISIIISPI